MLASSTASSTSLLYGCCCRSVMLRTVNGLHPNNRMVAMHLPTTKAPTLNIQQGGRSCLYFSTSPPRGTSGVRIPAHVAAFSLMLLPMLAFYVYYETTGKPNADSHLEEELRERYGKDIQAAHTKNQHMADFFQHVVLNPDGKYDDEINGLLKAGKGGKRRMAAVDERLYGTAEGVEQRNKYIAEHLAEIEQRKRKKKRMKRKKTAGEEERSSLSSKADDTTTANTPSVVSSNNPTSSSMSLLTVVAVATVAAAVGFVAGGKRS